MAKRLTTKANPLWFHEINVTNHEVEFSFLVHLWDSFVLERKREELKMDVDSKFTSTNIKNESFYSFPEPFLVAIVYLMYCYLTTNHEVFSVLHSLSGMLIRITVIVLIGVVAWAYQATRPPPPSVCGSPGGPPVTAPRVKLRDGRHLAYKEHGVSKEVANYKIVFIHGFGSCRHDAVITANLPPVLNSLRLNFLIHHWLCLFCYKLN
jgi:hypothetical protein